MNLKEIIERLHDLEKKVLISLSKKSPQTLEELISSTGLDEASVNRAVLWLLSKNLINVDEKISNIVSLTKLGKSCLSDGLPERKFFNLLKKGVNLIKEIRKNLSKDEFNISIGILKSKGLISIKDGKIVLNNDDDSWIIKSENFLKDAPGKEIENVNKELFEEFRKRGLVKPEVVIFKKIYAPQNISEIIKEIKKLGDTVGQLTPAMLVNKSWKNKKFRPYDVSLPGSRVFYGKKSIVTYMKEKIRKIFLNMGFTEIKGPIVISSFWNFDALYQPQDHPAREMHDTFFIKNPRTLPLPPKELVRRVASTHEDGWTTGSTGWGYKWKEEIAMQTVLRTHTTAATIKKIAELTKEDLPAKFFSVDTVFRNETLDYKHLFQFNQIEGIIIGEKISFKNLLGILKEFFNKLGFKKVRYRPGYFPYTEMSVEPEVLHPIKKTWMEVGGAGMFRPEVIKPLLGFEVPVIAWGLAFERSIMDVYNISDIRDIYSDDLNILRTTSSFTRRF